MGTTTIGKGSKEEGSGATDNQKHVKQKITQKPNGGQQPNPAPDGEETAAKKDVGKVKKPEVATDRQEPTTTIGKEAKKRKVAQQPSKSRRKHRSQMAGNNQTQLQTERKRLLKRM